MNEIYIRRLVFIFGILALTSFIQTANADEGMWTFDNLPKEALKQKYSFEPSEKWINHVMKSSVRFNSGGSGSFVSSTGLVLTNHHVAGDTLGKITKLGGPNYQANGFLAQSLEDEVKSPDLELNQLISIEDVTARVLASVKPEMTAAQAFIAKQAAMSQIEKESNEKTGLRSDVVTLYQGGRFNLYRYKKYTDVRLVFAPEFAIAFFGGDHDNFEFPRYDLDMCLFRVYENGKPAKIDNFLSWSPKGPAENELVFVSGNPGNTNRLLTVDAMRFYKDKRLPLNREMIQTREDMLLNFIKDSKGNIVPDRESIAHEDIFYVQNSRKSFDGQIKGLANPPFMSKKQNDESALKAQIAVDPKLKNLLEAWAQISKSEKEYQSIILERAMYELGLAFYSQSFTIARTLVRMAAEDLKPNQDRLPEFRESARESLLRQLNSEAPIYTDLEIAKLTSSLKFLIKKLGAKDPTVKLILKGKSPVARASELISKSKLRDLAVRKQIETGGQKSIDASIDPMILLAKQIDPKARTLRKTFEDKVTGPEQIAYSQISQAVFALKGTSGYPDATFTPRLSFGTVKGYTENGKFIEPVTTFGGAFKHELEHEGKEPFNLPPSWHQGKPNLDLSTPFNFVSTADIIGGNSGSPVINKNGDLVGLIFDGNIQSLVSNYIYDDVQSRAVSVHSSSIREALSKIYKAEKIAQELGH